MKSHQSHDEIPLDTTTQDGIFTLELDGQLRPDQKENKSWFESRLGWAEDYQRYKNGYAYDHPTNEFDYKTEALRHIFAPGTTERMMDETFKKKLQRTVTVLGGNNHELGVLDLGSLGIFRFLKNALASEDVRHSNTFILKSNKESGLQCFFRHLLSLPFYAQQALAYLLTSALTVTGILPFIHFVLYPPARTQKEILNARRRREAFFNPGTGLVAFLVLVGIILIIKGANPLVLVDAAAALAVMQSVFVGIAALMLMAAVISLTVHAIRSLVEWRTERQKLIPKAENTSDITEPQYQASKNGYVQYYVEKIKGWRSVNPKWGNFLYIVAGLSLLVTLTLIIGYFVDPAGIFGFMEPFFNFVGGMFTQGIQSAGTLTGLEFLGSISEPVLQLVSQVLTSFALVCAAIFLPDLLRRLSSSTIGDGTADLPKVVVTHYGMPDTHHQQTFQENGLVTIKFVENSFMHGTTFEADGDYTVRSKSRTDNFTSFEYRADSDMRTYEFPNNSIQSISSIISSQQNSVPFQRIFPDKESAVDDVVPPPKTPLSPSYWPMG